MWEAWGTGHSVMRDKPLGAGGYTEGVGVPVWAEFSVPVERTMKSDHRPGCNYKTAKGPFVLGVWLGQITSECPHIHVTD